jgi:hypothetical protein
MDVFETVVISLMTRKVPLARAQPNRLNASQEPARAVGNPPKGVTGKKKKKKRYVQEGGNKEMKNKRLVCFGH